MKRYFVVSDIHEHYTLLTDILKTKGFDINDSDHILIICGDVFERGDECYKLYLFIKGLISKKRLIWVMGNHDYIIYNNLKNRTISKCKGPYKTFIDLARGIKPACDLDDSSIIKVLDDEKILDMLEENLIPYYELGNYVFAHGFIPVNYKDVPIKPLNNWFKYTMLNGMKEVMVKGKNIEGKTIVCGHIMASYGNVRKNYDIEFWNDERFKKEEKKVKNLDNFKPFISDMVIGIDASCYRSGFINCLVFDEKGNIE